MELPAPFASLLTGTPAAIAGLTTVRMDRDVLLLDVPHWLYAGDTALHLAAAMLNVKAATMLLAAGADPRATNRRGATALHYACDPRPRSGNWNPSAQAAVIELLADGGADVNAADKGGVTPLHRAVRARSPRAVRTLLALRADPAMRTKRGSTAMNMARASTGAGGTAGTANEQQEIIGLLSGQ
jgi:ankyrin repeat protein